MKRRIEGMALPRWMVMVAWMMPMVVSGQIELSVKLSDDRILQGEPLFAFIEIENNAGKPILIGNQPGWLDVDIDQKVGGIALKTGSLAATKGVTISPGQAQSIPVRIDELYNLLTAARYTLMATLKVDGWSQTFKSKEYFFDVVTGTTIWNRAYSAPGLTGLNGQTGVFTYNLVTTAGANGKKLLFQIKDTDPVRILRTVPICKMISFSKPEAMIDPASNLHILCQYGRISFTYNIYNPRGELLVRTTYQTNPAKPFLHANSEGIIEVRGGKRVAMETDFLPDSFKNIGKNNDNAKKKFD